MKYNFKVTNFEGAKLVAQTLFQNHPNQDFSEAEFFSIEDNKVINFKVEGKLATLSLDQTDNDKSVNFSFSLADF